MLGTLAATALALTACSGGDGDDTPTPTGGTTDTASASASESASASAGATASPTPAPTVSATGDGTDGDATAPPFTANTEPDTSEPTGNALLTVTEVRAGRHEGYDRVVFELDGTGEGAPGWRVEYVDEAIDDGSGLPVDVDGDAILQVVISGTALPDDSGVEGYSGETLTGADLEPVKEVVYRHWFEGYTTAFIGIDDEPKPFRAFLLEDPVRVVIDVQD